MKSWSGKASKWLILGSLVGALPAVSLAAETVIPEPVTTAKATLKPELKLDVKAALKGRAIEALRGTDISGGGNATASRPITEREFQSAIADLRGDWRAIANLVAYFADAHANPIKFNYAYGVWTRTDNWWDDPSFPDSLPDLQKDGKLAIARKLVPQNGGETIFDRMKKVRYHIEKTGPCHDRDGQEVDASAYPLESDEICLSQPRLMAKLTSDNYQIQIQALAVHELSHKAGTTEEEALVLQNDYVEGRAQREAFRVTNESAIAQIGWELDALAQNGASPMKTCLTLSRALKALGETVPGGMGPNSAPPFYSFGGLKLERQMELMAIWTQMQMLLTVCYSDSDFERGSIATVFGDRRQVSMREFLHRYYAKETVNPANGGILPVLTPFGETVTLPASGDYPAILKAAPTLRDRLHALYSAIHNDTDY